MVSHSLPLGLISTIIYYFVVVPPIVGFLHPGRGRVGGGELAYLVILGIAIANRSAAKTKPIKELILHTWKMSALSNETTVLYPAQRFFRVF